MELLPLVLSYYKGIPMVQYLLQRDTLAPVTYMKTGVVYMGHKVDAEGIHPTNEKVEAIGKRQNPGFSSMLPTGIKFMKSNIRGPGAHC
jgi:hypothetical protein